MTSKAFDNATDANRQQGGRRNLIINGAMQVAQRGTSFTGVTGSSYQLDRFKWETNTEDTATIEQSTDAPNGFANSYKLTITTAETTIDSGEYASISQYMEGLNVQQLKYGASGAENITCSFWVKCSETGTATVALYQDDANQYISQSYTIDSANTWEYKTVTFVGNTGTAINNDNTIGLRLQFNVAGGSNYTGGSSNVWGTSANFQSGQTINLIETVNSTFQITGVQLEVGTVATPFEHRSFGEELALCQRYFQKINGNEADYVLGHGHEYDSGTLRIIVHLGVEMRSQVSLVEDSSSQEYRFNGNVGNFNTSGASIALDNNGSRTLSFRISGFSTSITENTQGAVKINSGGTYIACESEL